MDNLTRPLGRLTKPYTYKRRLGISEWSKIIQSTPPNYDSDSVIEEYFVTSTDYDVILLYASLDRKEAFEYLHHMRYDISKIGREINAEAKSIYDLLYHHDAVFKKCSYIFLYVTENLIEDLWVFERALSKLVDPIVLVYTKPKESFDLPFELSCCQGLDYFRNDALYRRSVVSLFKETTPTHLLQEKKLVEDGKLGKTIHVKDDDDYFSYIHSRPGRLHMTPLLQLREDYDDDYFSYMHSRLSARYFDLMVLCAQPDKLEAIRYLRYLRNKIRLKHGEKIKAVLYDKPSSLGALERHNLDEAFMRCSNVFLYFTSSFRKYIWSKIPRDSMLMQRIVDKKQSGRVVLVCMEISEPIPDELLHLQRLDDSNIFNINIVTSLFEKSAREMDTLQGERKTNVNIYDQSVDDLMCASLTALSPFETFHPNLGTSFFEGTTREMDTLQEERKVNVNIYGQSQKDLSEQSNALKVKTSHESIDELCTSLTALSPDIVHVWEGFKPYDQKRRLGRIFVAVVKRKLDNLKEKIQTCLSEKSFHVIQRLPDEVSDEAKNCLEKEANLDFTLEVHKKLRDTIICHSRGLMKSHSNLEIVSASKLRSRKNGETTIEWPCIVLYVQVKGIIPNNEQPFPQKVGDFLVDVREGVYTNFADPQLAMGSTIRGKDSTGKIAGFVHLPNGNIGCLTCAHVFKMHEDMEIDGIEPAKEDVFQVSPVLSNAPFGKLCKRIYEPGGHNETIGIDAALIEVTDRLRYPKDGNYKHSVSSSVVCENTLDYYSGEILTSSEEVAKMHIVNNMKCKIVRYNENKRLLYVRTGRINVDGTAVRLNAWWPITPNERCQLYAQMHILPDPNEIVDVEDKSFATYGDSGSLVFLQSEDGKRMWAFGMVVGGIEADGSAIVTPIWAVLDAFGLPRKFMSFKYLGSQFLELSAKVDNMDTKVNQIGRTMNQMDSRLGQLEKHMSEMLTIMKGKERAKEDQDPLTSAHNNPT